MYERSTPEAGGKNTLMVDHNPPLHSIGVTPPPNVQPNPPPGFENITVADVHSFRQDEEETTVSAPPNVTIPDTKTTETDTTPAPITPLPTIDCSSVDSLPNNFNWTSVAPTFDAFAASFQLSPNFTVFDLTVGPAVDTHRFTTSVVQQCGETQKVVLQNLCHLANTVLEKVRDEFGLFTITSGFRSQGGSSQHAFGEAADIQFLNFHGKNNTAELYFNQAKEVRDKINYDKFILEWFANNPWYHLSARRSGHRHITLTQIKGRPKSKYGVGLQLIKRR